MLFYDSMTLILKTGHGLDFCWDARLVLPLGRGSQNRIRDNYFSRFKEVYFENGARYAFSAELSRMAGCESRCALGTRYAKFDSGRAPKHLWPN